MKLFHLTWVLALAGAIAACDSGPPVDGCGPIEFVNSSGRCERLSGMGGTDGTGGGGGAPGGACTNEDDAMVYANLEYEGESGSPAASAIATDCVFGDGAVVGDCTDQAREVVFCANTMSCTSAEIDPLVDCVVTCLNDTVESITGSTLTAECSACYGDSVACSAANCATSGCGSNPSGNQCVQCRCDFDCTPGFDRCSGLPSSGACDG